MPVISSETVSMLAPHIFELVKGVFKTRKEVPETSEDQVLDMLNKDVLELQEVATKQGEALGEIAHVMEAKFAQLEKQLRLQKLLSVAAVVIAVIATAVAIAK